MSDPYDLQRFVDAQDPVYDKVLRRTAGWPQEKPLDVVHFPANQGSGLQSSGPQICHFFAGGSRPYLAHPILGPRLAECTGLVNLVEGRPIEQIFGYPDDLKFRSSMTLFAHATPDNQVFVDALQKYFKGEFDPATLARL